MLPPLISTLPAAMDAGPLPALILTLWVLMSVSPSGPAGRPSPTTALVLAVGLFGFLAYSLVQPDPLVDPTRPTPATVALYGTLAGLVIYIGYRLHRARPPVPATTSANLAADADPQEDIAKLPVRHFRQTRAELDEAAGLPIDWSPLRRGGSNFQTARLHVVSPERVAFRGTPMSIFFGGVFFVAGVGLLFAIAESSCMLPFALVFGGVGFYLLRGALQPLVFDRQEQRHWVGRKLPDDPEAVVDLTTVWALQLVPEYIHGDSDSAGYHSYELNLIFSDGGRHCVIDHGKREALKADAVRLGVFLGRPVWDNTGVLRDEVVVIEPEEPGRF